MPNLPTHIQLAISAADRMRHTDLDSNLGYFYLGSTSPDIRALTKRARSDYHFVELDFETIGAGVEAMFAAHPELMDAAEHDGPMRAFIAGYITHLIADESYIVKMFRPYFGKVGSFETDAMAKVWDRALQLDLDRTVWDEVMDSVKGLDADPANVHIEFLPQEDLEQWKEWVARVMSGGFSWERLRFMARRISAGDERHPAYTYAERFVQSVDESLDALYDHVPRSHVTEFRDEAVETIVASLRDYLS